MTTRWIDLRYPVIAGLACAAASAPLRSRELLGVAILFLLIALLLGMWRLYSDMFERATNAGGFPALGDGDRRNDEEFEILTMEQELLLRLNRVRQDAGVSCLAPQSDLLYLARRHALRMVKLPFFGTRDTEEGDICASVLAQRQSERVGVQVVRVSDREPDLVGHCLRRWMRRRRSRNIVLMPGFSQASVGIVRSERSRSYYVTCLLEAI
jgi:hypothetical protein